MRRFLLTFLLVVTVPAAASAQQGTITGVIRDADSGRVLPSARVEAFDPDGRAAGSALTNNEGRYRITVEPGTYTLTAQSVGYAVSRGTTATVAAGATATADIAMRTEAFQLNPVVISVTPQRTQKATDAPAHVEVISTRDIEARPALTPVDHLRTVPGVDVITQGVQATNVVTRGFNNIFSGSLHSITDHRLASVPSLRVNLLLFVPSTNEDLERMEVVLGPAAALYGPNTASGVLHMVTKSPLRSPGTTVSLTGGERDILQGAVRTAHRLNDQLGIKLSGQLMRGTEWGFVDPDEEAEAERLAGSENARAAFAAALGITPAEAERRIALIGARNNDINRMSVEGRVDYLIGPDVTTVLQAGVTNVGDGIELTGLGAAQAVDWRYSYVQARANRERLFAQVYYNMSDAGETYLLRTGQPIVDESTLLVGQVQHGFDLGAAQTFTYGLDYFFTDPRTRGTINGIYEDDDETTEIGGYLQSQTALTPKFDLVLAGRVDDHSALPDLVFSPRAALVFKPAEEQSFRATYNRAFSTPTSLNQFLDLPTAIPDQATNPLNAAAAQLGYSVRVQGTGTTGFTFRQDDGSYLMRSPFSQALGIGPNTTLLPTNAATFFPAAVQAVAAGAAAEGTPLDPELVGYLASLRPTGSEIGTNFIAGSQSLPIASLDLDDIAPIRETTTTTYELGYMGVLNDRFSIAADVWSSRIQDFVTPLTISTPLLALNGQDIGQYLVPRFMMDLGMSQEQAVALAGQLAPRLAQVPVGVISTAEINANGAQMLATYTNVDESLDLWGADLSVQTLITPEWSLTVNGSIVSDDHFETSVGTVTLNAPKRKGSIAVAFRPETGFNGELRARFNSEYPVKSGVYEATNCLTNTTLSLPCVESYTLVDLTLGYSLPQVPGAAIHLSVQNVLDEGYRSFPGVPEIGRLALLRLKYDF